MKGILFNSVADAVVGLGGDELWDDVLDRAGLSGAYTSLGSYDDEEFLALVAVAADMLGRTFDDTVEYLGELVFPHLSGRHSDLIAEHHGAISLLCALNDVIHPEVLKLYPDASVPDFTTLRREGNELDLLYRSARNLPALAAGLIRGAANLYQQDVSIKIESVEGGSIFRLVFEPSDRLTTVPVP